MLASDPRAIGALADHFGDGIKIQSSQCMPGPKLSDVMGDRHFKCILEIGTWQGISAAILAEHADNVITLDVVRRPEPEQVWAFFGVQDKIHHMVVDNDEKKAAVVRCLDFDAAFIDANHDRAHVSLDFAICRAKCGCILFHDYPYAVPMGTSMPTSYDLSKHPPNSTGDGVGFLLDCVRPAGEIVRLPPFAWWRAPK